MPLDDVEATLRELHAAYAGQAGFLDVYYVPGPAPEFHPTFVGEVPASAVLVPTRVPVAFDVIPSYPIPTDPGAAPSVSDVQCTGKIRPGARLTVGCTTSFIFAQGADRYVGTAGHCYTTTGGAASIDGVGIFGTVVFTTGNGGVGNDFALIKVNSNKLALVTPEMCDWAGPKTAFAGPSINGKPIVHTGHGQWVGLIGGLPPRPREYVGSGWGATSFNWYGGAIGGDSGSAIRLVENGGALGTVTHSLGVVVGTPTIGYGTRWDHGLSLAAASGLGGLSLMTVTYTHGP